MSTHHCEVGSGDLSELTRDFDFCIWHVVLLRVRIARRAPPQALWRHDIVHTSDGVGVSFELDSHDKDGGFPGHLAVKVRGTARYSHTQSR